MKKSNLRFKYATKVTPLFLGLLLGINGYSQEITKKALIKMWYLDTYKIGQKEYPPNRRERDDFILFEDNMSFVSKTEGKEDKGLFTLNSNGGYVEFVDNNGERLKAHIISIDAHKLILKFDIKEMREITVHYKSQK